MAATEEVNSLVAAAAAAGGTSAVQVRRPAAAAAAVDSGLWNCSYCTAGRPLQCSVNACVFSVTMHC
jgi:hypothetical protein